MVTVNDLFKKYFSHITGTRLKIITFITALVFLLLLFKASMLVIFHARFMFNASVYSLIFLNFCLLFCKKKGWTIFVGILFSVLLFVNVFDTIIITGHLQTIAKYRGDSYVIERREFGHDGFKYIIKEAEGTTIRYTGFTVNRNGIVNQELSKDGKIWTGTIIN